ncbi:penicillin-binding protein 1A [Thiohalobacter sp. IOR34]|uniref:penicillin-binding protein 1A n=1 Tax=Thiohalobacter sp. IOR34 TaxID=3057176 RepID=UPI0025B256A6|nr:penicillin-binding protein 1A [Thiohalobacter sp. IOR34]WJW75690.1 penicillin-binding protein 1A [Thiohalobacter sp. IOR34]
MKILRVLLAALATVTLLGGMAAAATYFYLTPRLPPVEALRELRLQVPLRVYSADRQLIAEFGEKRRVPVRYEDLPQQVIQAFLAAEDDRFFDHPGVDYQGLIRAGVSLLRTGEKRQGGSTITMQVARNFFLSREKTYLRKLTEILLALKIERELSKEQILELYLNKIYLGHRAYGVGAAAKVYYGRDLRDLSLPQIAMIAGLPKAPSRDNPVSNPARAIERRNYVLGRMYSLGYIDAETYRAALLMPDDARLHKVGIAVEAPFAAEMVRAEMVRRFGEAAYTRGYSVYTSLDSARQAAANRALREALLAYDRRHGYRGPEARIELAADAGPADIAARLEGVPVYGDLFPAIVVAVEDKAFSAVLRNGEQVQVEWEGLSWARAYKGRDRLGPRLKRAAEVVQPGDRVRLRYHDDAWRLSQLPAVEGALLSVDPDSGAIQALVGGFDFYRSKFNRAVQARRQPGSSFKPIIYSAALEKGFTPASILNDAPVVFDDPALERVWRPENYSGRFYGPTRLREALTHSRNLVSIRLLRAIGVPYAIEYAQRFGFRPEQLPANLSLSLGSGSVSPLDMARAYSVFANGGFRIEPYLISRILDADGTPLYEADPAVACRECEAADAERPLPVAASAETTTDGPAAAAVDEAAGPQPPRRAERVITAQNDWLMLSMLQDVIRRGTGRRALQLGRRDLAGKTGTTNDQRDAWFCGFTPALVTVSWVGFDEVAPLGRRETGSRAALPMWIAYMREALKGVPEIQRDPPAGLISVRIDPATGLLAGADQRDAIFETFREENVPRRLAVPPGIHEGEAGADEGSDALF